MRRFHGEVGYGEQVEKPEQSGVYVEEITEFPYFGDVLRNSRTLERGDKINEDISVSASISIVADQYAIDHFHKIKYVRWEGVTWVVTTVEPRRPRLILTLGSVYNGPTPATPESP